MARSQHFFPRNKKSNYEEVLTGAHRNPPARARPPFVVAHLGFWCPLPLKSVADPAQPAEKLAEELRDRRKILLDAYLSDLWSII